jgi:hydrogenase nickel incorporation protein HypB
MTTVKVVQSVLKANDAVAAANRRRIMEGGILGLNLMSAPGSGKTTLLQKTIPLLESPCAVLVGDLQTTRDAERLEGVARQTVQINTGRGCHLSATEVADGLDALDLNGIEYLFIENVGNMVCPASHDLGEHARCVLLSVPEGDDKVAKYPTLFQAADLILVNKIDLIGVLEFSLERVREDLAQVNSSAPLLLVSARTGKGLTEWTSWLRNRQRALAVGEINSRPTLPVGHEDAAR